MAPSRILALGNESDDGFDEAKLRPPNRKLADSWKLAIDPMPHHFFFFSISDTGASDHILHDQ